MNRREFIVSSVAASAALAMNNIAHASHHEKGKHKHKAISSEMKAVVATAADCLRTGALCRAHCLSHLESGNTDMLDCLKSVENMMAVCESTMHLAAMGTMKKKTLKQALQFCATVCDECAETCKPHVKMHAECKDCMESCVDCAKACRKAA